MASVTVTGSLADIWGVEEEELFGLASMNTPKLNRGQISPLSGELDSLGEPNPQRMRDAAGTTGLILPALIKIAFLCTLPQTPEKYTDLQLSCIRGC